MPCTHLAEAKDPAPRTPGGCEECLKAGSSWVQLRVCRTCGHVGCCDSTPGRHATEHFRSTGHPIMRSVEQGWTWCYVDEAMVG